MGLARLDDAEYARRSRERNNRVNAAHRQRLLESGKAQTNVWLSAELRAQLDRLAIADSVNLSTIVERLLSASLADSAIAEPSTIIQQEPDTADMFASAEPDPTYTKKKGAEPDAPTDLSFVSVGNEDSKAAMMQEVGNLLSTGLSGAEIARRLNAAGHRTTKGNTLIGANLLREYRAWSTRQE